MIEANANVKYLYGEALFPETMTTLIIDAGSIDFYDALNWNYNLKNIIIKGDPSEIEIPEHKWGAPADVQITFEPR